jgi:hypothetical protein
MRSAGKNGERFHPAFRRENSPGLIMKKLLGTRREKPNRLKPGLPTQRGLVASLPGAYD